MPSQGTSAVRASNAQRVYNELRTRLLRGELPAGQRLVEERLAEEFDTSRTPVREALRRLEGDGYLERVGSGLRPSVPNVASMNHFYDVRLTIEELVVRRAAQAGDRKLLSALMERWRAYESDTTGGGPDFVHTDEDFHQTIAHAAGNPIAEQVLRDVNARIRLLRIHDFTSEDRIRATIAEHQEILDAVLEADADAACAFMRAHVQRSAVVVRKRVDLAVSRMVDQPSDDASVT